MEIRNDAPVVARSEIEIAADAERVWAVLTDIRRWPEWNPDVKSVSMAGDVAPGSTFRWKAGPGTITSTLQRMERPRLIGWTGKTFGIDAIHVFRLEPRDSTTLVRTEESYEGLIARALRGPLQRMLQRSLEAGLRHLKAEAERI